MEAAEFAERLSSLTGPEIADIATALRREHETADGEVSWWRATIAIGDELKRHHRSREAGLAAHQAATAVQHAARKADVDVSKDDTTIVARAAAEVARMLVADHDHDVPRSMTDVLLAPWRVVDLAAA